MPDADGSGDCQLHDERAYGDGFEMEGETCGDGFEMEGENHQPGTSWPGTAASSRPPWRASSSRREGWERESSSDDEGRWEPRECRQDEERASGLGLTGVSSIARLVSRLECQAGESSVPAARMT